MTVPSPTQGLSHREQVVSNTGISLVPFPFLSALGDISWAVWVNWEAWPSPPEGIGGEVGGWNRHPWLHGDSSAKLRLGCFLFTTRCHPQPSHHCVSSHSPRMHRETGPQGTWHVAKFTGQNQVGTRTPQLVTLELSVPVASQTWSIRLEQRPSRGWIFIPSPGPHRPGLDPVSFLSSCWPPPSPPAGPRVLMCPS